MAHAHAFPCPACSKVLGIPADKIGRKVRCPGCKTIFTAELPNSQPESAPLPPAPPQTRPALAALAVDYERPATRKLADLHSRDRQLAARLCRLISLLILIVGVGGTIAQLFGVITIFGVNNPSAFGKLLGIALITILFQLAYAALLFWLAALISAGGKVSVWIVAILAILASLGCLFLILGGSIIALTGDPNGWLLVLAFLLLLTIYAKLAYHAVRILALSGRQLRDARDDPSVQESAASFLSFLGFRRAALLFALPLLLLNAGYALFAAKSLQPSLAPPPAVSDPPIATASQPFNKDVFDPKEGLPKIKRDAIIASLDADWRPNPAKNRELDNLLRERGASLAGESPVGYTGGDVSKGEQIKGWLFRGSFKTDHWQYQFGDMAQSADRWACFALQREMDKLLARFPAATPLQQQAVFDLLRTSPLPSAGSLTLPPITTDGNDLIYSPAGRDFRITPEGVVFDNTPSRLDGLDAQRRQTDERRAAQRFWTLAPTGLLLDAALGILLALRFLWLALAGPPVPPALRRASFISLAIFILAAAWCITAYIHLDGRLAVYLVDARTWLILLAILFWKAAQQLAPFLLARLHPPHNPPQS